jgi:hypothetical protein
MSNVSDIVDRATARLSTHSRNGSGPDAAAGGPSPWLVLGVAFLVGVALARLIDWRAHAHPRD